MIRIGLLTYYRSNYGAALQAYALKEFIESAYKNIKVYTIDYYKNRSYHIFEAKSNSYVKRLVKYGFILLHYFDIRRRNKRHVSFNQKFLEQERYDFSTDGNFKLLPEYDLYLTGSDQVFNIKNNSYKLLFFQQFSRKGIHAAYAPSFGQSVFSDEEKSSIRNLTKSFDFLSCRENDGAEMLSLIHGKKVQCVIDPTLLLMPEQWNKMTVTPKSNNKYLLVYDLNGGISMLNIAKKVALEKGLKIFCITRHPDMSFIYKGIDKVIFDAGPREFVGYFSKASYVITDSFHGTAFSINFRKPFNTFIALPKAAQRIESLLRVCDLLNRIVPEVGNADTSEDCFSTFDNKSFDEYRNLSISFLTDIISKLNEGAQSTISE